jgi:hypothetical protein
MERNHKINIRESLLNNKQKQAPNKILRGHVPQSTSDYPNRQPPGGIVDGRNEEGVTKVGGALPRDLLDDGQGKCEAGTSDMEISTNSDGSASPPVERTSNQKLLLPPVIEATGLRATVVTTDIQRKQNKQQGMVHLEQQRPASQWNIHQGHTLLREDHWVEVRKTANAAQMAPQGLALHHERQECWQNGRLWDAQHARVAIGLWQKSKRPSIAAHTGQPWNRTHYVTLLTKSR